MKFKPSSNDYYDIAGDEEVDDDLNHVVVRDGRRMTLPVWLIHR